MSRVRGITSFVSSPLIEDSVFSVQTYTLSVRDYSYTSNLVNGSVGLLSSRQYRMTPSNS